MRANKRASKGKKEKLNLIADKKTSEYKMKMEIVNNNNIILNMICNGSSKECQKIV